MPQLGYDSEFIKRSDGFPSQQDALFVTIRSREAYNNLCLYVADFLQKLDNNKMVEPEVKEDLRAVYKYFNDYLRMYKEYANGKLDILHKDKERAPFQPDHMDYTPRSTLVCGEGANLMEMEAKDFSMSTLNNKVKVAQSMYPEHKQKLQQISNILEVAKYIGDRGFEL